MSLSTVKIVVFALFSPLGTSIALVGISIVLCYLGYHRWGKRLGLTSFVWLLFWSMPASCIVLINGLERNFPPLSVQTLPKAQSIVVLGGAIRPPNKTNPFPNMNSMADRIWHAARLYHAGKAPLLVLSGGGGRKLNRTEAAAMKLLLSDLGVPASAMILEGRSRNTRENAQFSAALLREKGIDTVLLVTSAMHMCRALTHFRNEGLDVVAVATDHIGGPISSWLQFVPNAEALLVSALALKEWIGCYIYK